MVVKGANGLDYLRLDSATNEITKVGTIVFKKNLGIIGADEWYYSDLQFIDASLSPDGTLLATHFDDAKEKGIQIWGVPKGQIMIRLNPTERKSSGSPFGFSPDGKTFAASQIIEQKKFEEKRVVVLWDTATWKTKHVLFADQPDQWHLSYGITEDRKNALTEDNGRYSLLNPNSETALTLFLLGRLDQWVQCRALHTQPRSETGWNRTLFQNLRNSASNVADAQLPLRTPLRGFLAEQLGFPLEALGDAVLMFEFEARNRGFDGGTGFDTLSFLNIKQKWSLFDAAVIVPGVKRFVFFESKLGADIGRRTTHFKYVTQVMRNLESAFFLCHHPASVYQGWDFKYVMICPRKEYEYRLAYYACLFNDVALHLNLFRDILTTEYAALVSEERLDRFYDEFRQLVPERVAVRHWDQFWPLLRQDGFDLARYERAVQAELGADAALANHAFRNRLQLAGIEEAIANAAT